MTSRTGTAIVVRRIRSALLVAVVTAALPVACGSQESPATPVAGAASSRPVAPVTSVRPSSAASTTIDPYAGLPLIDRVEWTENDQGARLLVFPTVAGRRTAAPDGGTAAWREVLDHAPDADSPGMRDQFVCHWDWARLVAPNKPSWNLEPWRPDVGYDAVVQASCNPGGPEQ